VKQFTLNNTLINKHNFKNPTNFLSNQFIFKKIDKIRLSQTFKNAQSLINLYLYLFLSCKFVYPLQLQNKKTSAWNLFKFTSFLHNEKNLVKQYFWFWTYVFKTFPNYFNPKVLLQIMPLRKLSFVFINNPILKNKKFLTSSNWYNFVKLKFIIHVLALYWYSFRFSNIKLQYWLKWTSQFRMLFRKFFYLVQEDHKDLKYVYKHQLTNFRQKRLNFKRQRRERKKLFTIMYKFIWDSYIKRRRRSPIQPVFNTRRNYRRFSFIWSIYNKRVLTQLVNRHFMPILKFKRFLKRYNHASRLQWSLEQKYATRILNFLTKLRFLPFHLTYQLAYKGLVWLNGNPIKNINTVFYPFDIISFDPALGNILKFYFLSQLFWFFYLKKFYLKHTFAKNLSLSDYLQGQNSILCFQFLELLESCEINYSTFSFTFFLPMEDFFSELEDKGSFFSWRHPIFYSENFFLNINWN